MNKQAYEQAYEHTVGLVIGLKKEDNMSKYAKSPIKEYPILGTSSLISSTPSSLVADVLSSPL